jgi:hypothetical protein
MNGINVGGVTRGGFVAGLIINISETILNVPVLGARMTAVWQRFNLPDSGGAAIALFVVISFAVGWLMVWLYAAVRPRLGPGPKTALCVGLLVWTLWALFPTVGYVSMGFFPVGLAAIAVIWTLVELPLAAVVGAWLYKEPV